MANFPSTLPKPVIDGYTGIQDQSFIRTEMEAGSVRQRQRYSAVNTQLNVTWFFSGTEMASFKTFYDTTINRGTDWFTYTLDAGSGMLSYDVRFTQPFQFSKLEGTYWRVSANLELRNA